jgi:hypothetical protein
LMQSLEAVRTMAVRRDRDRNALQEYFQWEILQRLRSCHEPGQSGWKRIDTQWARKTGVVDLLTKEWHHVWIGPFYGHMVDHRNLHYIFLETPNWIFYKSCRLVAYLSADWLEPSNFSKIIRDNTALTITSRDRCIRQYKINIIFWKTQLFEHFMRKSPFRVHRASCRLLLQASKPMRYNTMSLCRNSAQNADKSRADWRRYKEGIDVEREASGTKTDWNEKSAHTYSWSLTLSVVSKNAKKYRGAQPQ